MQKFYNFGKIKKISQGFLAKIKKLFCLILSFRCLASIPVCLAVGGSGCEHLHIVHSSPAWRHPGVPGDSHLPLDLHAGFRTHTAAPGGCQCKANSLLTIHASFSSALCLYQLIKCQSGFWIYRAAKVLLEKTSCLLINRYYQLISRSHLISG